MPIQSKKNKTYEVITEQLLQEIDDQVYKVGEKLPTERELSERFKASRTTVREAIRYLESLGCVKTKRGSGTFVKAPDMSQLTQTVSSKLLHPPIVNFDVIEVRRMFDSTIGVLAASRRTNEQLQLLKENIEKTRACIAEGRSIKNCEEEFHILLARATNNLLLSNIVELCFSVYVYTVKLSSDKPGMPESALHQHEAIVKAIEERDVTKIRSLMKQHTIKSAYKRMENF